MQTMKRCQYLLGQLFLYTVSSLQLLGLMPQQQASYMIGSINEEEEPELSPPKWSASLFKDAYDELVWRGRTFLTNSFQNEESVVGKIGLFLELPLIALRTVCIPVPCEDYYCRPIVVSVECSNLYLLSLSVLKV